MALNDLLYRHQLSLMRAASASTEGRDDHLACAAAYADQVAELARSGGATAAPLARS